MTRGGGRASLRVYYPDTPDIPLPAGHRFPASKYRMLRALLEADGLIAPGQLAPSPLASRDELERAHDAAYVAAVLDGSVSAAVQRAIGLPWSEVLVERSRATCGGTLASARTALTAGLSGQLAGGTHHAHREAGSGFCVFNDCAVAAFALLDGGQIRRAAVLDLDVHQGDGNAAMFGSEPRVFTASVHGQNNFPFAKWASDLDLPLADGTGDADYLAACRTALDAVIASAPELIFYIAGVDPLASDRLGRLEVSMAGLRARDAMVLGACWARRIPTVILIGGGYAEPISDTVRAYAQTFEVAQGIISSSSG